MHHDHGVWSAGHGWAAIDHWSRSRPTHADGPSTSNVATFTCGAGGPACWAGSRALRRHRRGRRQPGDMLLKLFRTSLHHRPQLLLCTAGIAGSEVQPGVGAGAGGGGDK